MTAPLLEVRSLKTRFRSDRGEFPAVDGISFTLQRGATLGIVGESGCGKSVTALSILRLVARPGHIASGEILFDGRDLLRLPEAEMRKLRGNKISMVFQEPMTALNPVFTAGEQVAEAVRLHQGLDAKAARQRAIETFREVGIPDPEERVDAYPHQLSGGMRQRVVIAMALACSPDLLIADEPTTALDVTIQAQILALLKREKDQRRMGLVLISHSLAVIAETCEEVLVMYAGKVVEHARADALFSQPAHPYTAGLLKSLPSFRDLESTAPGRRRLFAVPGSVPPPGMRVQGCAFRERCDRATERCAREEPALQSVGAGHEAACFHPVNEGERSVSR